MRKAGRGYSHAADAEVINGVKVGPQDVLVKEDLLSKRVHLVQRDSNRRRCDEVLHTHEKGE